MRRCGSESCQLMPINRRASRHRALLPEGGDGSIVVARLAQDFAAVLAELRRRPGGPWRGEAEAQWRGNALRHLVRCRLHDDAGVQGLLVARDVAYGVDRRCGNADLYEALAPIGPVAGRKCAVELGHEIGSIVASV